MGSASGRQRFSVPAGQAYSGATPSTSTPVLVLNGQALPSVKGTLAKVDFAGPVSAGQYQMNIEIPQNAPVGEAPIVAAFTGKGQISSIGPDNQQTQSNCSLPCNKTSIEGRRCVQRSPRPARKKLY
jgi:hypothetical protein